MDLLGILSGTVQPLVSESEAAADAAAEAAAEAPPRRRGRPSLAETAPKRHKRDRQAWLAQLVHARCRKSILREQRMAATLLDRARAAEDAYNTMVQHVGEWQTIYGVQVHGVTIRDRNSKLKLNSATKEVPTALNLRHMGGICTVFQAGSVFASPGAKNSAEDIKHQSDTISPVYHPIYDLLRRTDRRRRRQELAQGHPIDALHR